MTSIYSGWLETYGTFGNRLRRFVTVNELVGKSNKAVYIYKSEAVANDTSKATQTIKMENCYFVMEYFGPLNYTKDDLHFIINQQRVFKCQSKQERDDWIREIISTQNSLSLNMIAQKQSTTSPSKSINKNKNNNNMKQNSILKNRLFTIVPRSDVTNVIKSNMSMNKVNKNRLKNGCIVQIPIKILTFNMSFFLNVNCGQTTVYNTLSLWQSGDIQDTPKQKLVKVVTAAIDKSLRPMTGEICEIWVIKENGNNDNSYNNSTMFAKTLVNWDSFMVGSYEGFVNNFIKEGLMLSIICNHKYNRNIGDKIHQESRGFEHNLGCNFICEMGLQCPVYLEMKNEYKYTMDHYNHLISYKHFNSQLSNKPNCKYGIDCKAFNRLNRNESRRFDDICHFEIYKHPPRNERQTNMAKNVNQLIMIETADKIVNNNNNGDVSVENLIYEVIKNGFKSDLVLNESKWELWNDLFTILYVVNEKIDATYHKRLGSPLSRGEMLALILYTSCDCNYALCKSQRKGDYTKWVLFDAALNNGIKKLSQFERIPKNIKLYSGLNNVNLKENIIRQCFLATYISTSWNRDVSMQFIKENGMLIEFNSNVFLNSNSNCNSSLHSNSGLKCCTVDWISKFPDECEILVARTSHPTSNKIDIQVLRGSLDVSNDHGDDMDDIKQSHKETIDEVEESKQDIQIITVSLNKDYLIDDNFVKIVAFGLSTDFDRIINCISNLNTDYNYNNKSYSHVHTCKNNMDIDKCELQRFKEIIEQNCNQLLWKELKIKQTNTKSVDVKDVKKLLYCKDLSFFTKSIYNLSSSVPINYQYPVERVIEWLTMNPSYLVRHIVQSFDA